MFSKTRLLIFTLFIVGLCFSTGYSSALTTVSSQNLIKVSPSIINLDLSKDYVTSSFSVDITNNSKNDISLN